MSEKRKDYLSWKEYFMGVAQLSAQRSKDPNTQVGAVVVKPEQRIIVSTGYNGFPWGIDDDQFPWKREGQWIDTKYPYVAHAELNAVVAARTDLSGCEVYVTLFPCHECSKILIQAGIKKIYYLDDKYADTENILVAKKMLTAAKIVYQQLPLVKVLVKTD